MKTLLKLHDIVVHIFALVVGTLIILASSLMLILYRLVTKLCVWALVDDERKSALIVSSSLINNYTPNIEELSMISSCSDTQKQHLKTLVLSYFTTVTRPIGATYAALSVDDITDRADYIKKMEELLKNRSENL